MAFHYDTHLDEPVLVIQIVGASWHVAFPSLDPLITLNDSWPRNCTEGLQRLSTHLLTSVARKRRDRCTVS